MYLLEYQFHSDILCSRCWALCSRNGKPPKLGNLSFPAAWSKTAGLLPALIAVWDTQEPENGTSAERSLLPHCPVGKESRFWISGPVVLCTVAEWALKLAVTSPSELWEWAPPGGLISSEQQACLNAVSINPRFSLPPFLSLFLSACPGEHPYLTGVYRYALLPWVEIHDDRSNWNAL